jgi:hypothetical protein
MLINLPNRLHILKLLPVLLFSCFATTLFSQILVEQTLKSDKIAAPEIVSKTDSFCGATFFKRLFIEGQSTSGRKIVPAPNQNFYIAAAVGDLTMIALVDRKMEVIWAQSVDFGPGFDNFLDMRTDTDGQLIGVGNTSTSVIECFAFKMNAADGQLLWRSRLNDPGNSYFSRILEKNSGANYLLFGQTDLVGTGNDSGCDALLMEIDRNTGELLWDRQYDLGSCEIVSDVFIENNQIYTCGRYNLVNGGQSRFRGAMSLFDTDGNVNWSRHYLRNNQDARLYFSSIVHENDSLVAFGYGDDGGISLTATTLQLVKTDLTGAANWAKEYDVVGGNEERSTRLLNLADGYLLFGTFVRQTAASREICLLKTDKQGNLLWGKSYGDIGEDRLSDVILIADTLYLIGSRQNAQVFDILIGKMDLNGDVDGQCDFVKSLDVTVSDYSAPLDFSHNLVELDITHNYATASLPEQTAENNVVTEVICQKICDDSCDKPDASVTIDSIFCWEGQTVIFLRIHNTGFAQYPANSMLSFYDADPTSSAANLLRTMLIPFAIDTGTSLSVEIYDGHTFLPMNSNFVLYAVVNDDGSLPTPFSFSSFPQTGTEECDYANNAGSRPFTASGAPMLDLGPDVSLCATDILVVQAGAGFFQYQWQDGSSDSTFLINTSGTYWVEVTDECGYKQIDSVTVTVLPLNERTETVEFCPGDIVQIGGEEYDQPGTVLDTLPGSGTDCDTVVTYTLQYFQNSIVQIQCPANVSVEAAAGTNSATVNYNLPAANSDCPCSLATAELLQGLASGSDFPVGTTQVCYEASDDCGGANSCCFTVTVQAAPPEEACDVKNTPCVKFEILGISQNPAKQRTYRMRVTNSCANKLIYTTFQLPDGVVADAPATNTTYTAPSGRQYEVRNPNFSPAHSIRFKAIGDGIANGESDIFEYTLPPQSEPLFIYATAKLFPQIFAETYLNVFGCPVQQTSNRPPEAKERQGISNPVTSSMTIFPNPASDVLNVRLPDWSNQQVRIRVTDAYGRLMFEQTSVSNSNLLKLELPTNWPTGIYYLEAVNEKSERQTGRFVRATK